MTNQRQDPALDHRKFFAASLNLVLMKLMDRLSEQLIIFMATK
jgi:hypothetical protein